MHSSVQSSGLHVVRVIVISGIIASGSGCELIGPDTEEDLRESVTSGVLVANQGNFADANGSLLLYDPETGTGETLAEELGSIVQSVLVHSGHIFVASNSADRVDVFDVETLTRVAQIDGVVSPRYFAPAGDGTIYVTNLFTSNFQGGSVTVLDVETFSASAKITVGDNPEGIAVRGGLAYVANHGYGAGRTVSVIDTATRRVVATHDVDCDGPRWAVPNVRGELYVFCTGQTIYDDSFNEIGKTDGRVLALDAAGEELRRFELEDQITTSGPGQDVFVENAEGLAFVVSGGAILVFDMVSDVRLPDIAPGGDTPVGGVAYDAGSDRLFVARVPSFVESGWVEVYNATGLELSRFQAGIAPSYITFLR